MFNRKDYELANGSLQAFAFPGGYPLYYAVRDGGILCPGCANSSRAREATVDCSDDEQWPVVGAGINWEDSAMYCDNCNNVIESAYGED